MAQKLVLDSEVADAIAHDIVKACIENDGHVLNWYAGALIAAASLITITLTVGTGEEKDVETNRATMLGMLREIADEIEQTPLQELQELRQSILKDYLTEVPAEVAG